jgi:hypothetical protein
VAAMGDDRTRKRKSPPFGKFVRRTWRQPNFRGLPRDLRLMLNYLWTNEPGAGGTGLYYCPVPVIADDLDVDASTIRTWFHQVRVYSVLSDHHKVNLHRFKNGDAYDFTAAQAALLEAGTDLASIRVQEWGIYDAGWFEYDFDNRLVFLPRQLHFDPPDNKNVIKGMIGRILELPKSMLWFDWIECVRPHARRFKMSIPPKMTAALKEIVDVPRFGKPLPTKDTGKGSDKNGKGLPEKGEILSQSRSQSQSHIYSRDDATASAMFHDPKDADQVEACVGAYHALVTMFPTIKKASAVAHAKRIVELFWDRGQPLLKDEMEHATRIALRRCETTRGVYPFLKQLTKADQHMQVVEIAQEARRDADKGKD